MYQVLLVDDEPILQLGIREMIDWENTPFRLCSMAANGEQALRYIEAHPVDMVLTDLKMPVMDGIQLIRELKRRDLRIPIVVLSNYSTFDLVREALLEGALDYLLKVDLDGDKLLQRLDRMASAVEASRKDMLDRQRQSRLLEQQHREVSLARLRTFLLGGGMSAEEIQAQTLTPVGLVPPFTVFTIFFPESDIRQDRLRRIQPHIESLIAATFPMPVVFLRDRSEILCLLCGEELSKQAFGEWLRKLQRQLATYFSIAPIISYALDVMDAEALRPAYGRCAEAREMRFYAPNTAFFAADECALKQQWEGGALDKFVSDILDCVRADDICALDELVHETVLVWSALSLHPRIARQLCANVMDYVRYSGAIEGSREIVEAKQRILTQTQTAAALEQEFQAGLRSLLSRQSRPFAKCRPEIQAALTYLHTHYAERITLDSIAEAAFLNRSYLCRLFKKEMNMSIFNYLNRLRMETAADLIRSRSDIYIHEIAKMVGIDEPFYFTRKFKEYYGVSPREYASKFHKEIREM